VRRGKTFILTDEDRCRGEADAVRILSQHTLLETEERNAVGGKASSRQREERARKASPRRGKPRTLVFTTAFSNRR
jgi:hypothetical protein